MQFKVALLTLLPTFFAITQAGLFFPLHLYPPKPAPPPAGCPSLQVKPLGSFVFGPSFPNPWSGVNVPLNVPNCNAPPPPPPAPACPAGQSCKGACPPAPACPAGQSCQGACPPAPVCPGNEFCQPPSKFPSAQVSFDKICNAQPYSPPRRACLDSAGTPRSSGCCY